MTSYGVHLTSSGQTRPEQLRAKFQEFADWLKFLASMKLMIVIYKVMFAFNYDALICFPLM